MYWNPWLDYHYQKHHSRRVKMNESKEIHAIRAMAWERAKGELRSMRHTYYSKYDELGNFKLRLEEFDEIFNQFVKNIESNGLHE